MPQRKAAAMGIRIVPENGVKVLAVQGIGKSEDLAQLICPVQSFSIPAVAGSWAFSGPLAFLEANLAVLYVPWNVVSTFVKDNFVVGMPTTDTEWDELFGKCLIDSANAAGDVFGGNPDDRAVYDPDTYRWGIRRGVPPTTRDEPSEHPDDVADASNRMNEPLLEYGPTGIVRLDSSEFFLTPSSVSSALRGLGAVTGIASSTLGLNDIIFTHYGQMSGSGPLDTPGFLMVGCYRYDAGYISEGFAWTGAGSTTLTNTDDEAIRKARAQALATFIGDDREKIEFMLKYGSDEASVYLRTILMKGDNYIEGFPSSWATALLGASTQLFETVSGLTVADSFLRPNDIVVGVKMASFFLTPYEVRAL